MIDSTLIYGFWLQRGRGAEAEAELERLFGGLHVKYSMAELSKSERGDDADAVKFSELISPRNFGGKNVNLFQISLVIVPICFLLKDYYCTSLYAVVFIGSTLFALQQLSGINAVFYFSSTVFKNAGVPSDSGNICVGIANLSGAHCYTPKCFNFVNVVKYLS